MRLEDIDDDVFLIHGRESLEKPVKPIGNGAHVTVPKRWRGATVKIIRVDEPDPEPDND